ncbi:MAG: RNA methyltransferase [Candidatus Poribacteria bacterium]|nr:RNA methyltransferase [Candidatus Poribacteria bacterium]
MEKIDPNAEEVLHFKQAYRSYSETGVWQQTYQVFTSGWENIDGAMLIKPEDTLDADYRVYLTATTERSLRELLLAFPRQCAGMFHIAEEWIEERIGDILEGDFVHTDSRKYFRGIKRGSRTKAEQRVVSKRKDEIAAHIRKLASLKGKFEHSQFVIEGEMMVERAVADGLPIETILYTTDFVATSDGKKFIKQVFDENLSCYSVNDGVMGSVTTTRPVPSIVASIHLNYPPFLSEFGQLNFHFSRNCILLIAENVRNPDNLGMTLRTADAAGVSAVLLSGNGASPFHKNCIRASRGAVGRLPMFQTPKTNLAIEQLKLSGWRVIGATAKTENDLYTMEYTYPTAIVVGNENTGLSDETRECCTDLVRIPMAAGQSSLNVGVAAGVLLFELSRQKRSIMTSI